jgi:hypothetical protein
MAIDFRLRPELEAWTWMERSMMRPSMLATLGCSADSPLAHTFPHARWARFADGPDEVRLMRIAQRTIAAYKQDGSTRRATVELPV